MRAVVLCVLASLALAAPAIAQPSATRPSPAGQGRPDRVEGMAPDRPPVARHDGPRARPGPSGYWTGYRPGKGGAYRWRMLAIGLAVLALTLVLVIRLLRRAAGRAVGRPRVTS